MAKKHNWILLFPWASCFGDLQLFFAHRVTIFFFPFCHSQLPMESHLRDTEPHLPVIMSCLLDTELGDMEPLLLSMELPLWAMESCLLDMKLPLWITESHLPDMESHLPDTRFHLPDTKPQLWDLDLHLLAMKPHLWVMRLLLQDIGSYLLYPVPHLQHTKLHLLGLKQVTPLLWQPRLLDSRHLFPLPHLHKPILPLLRCKPWSSPSKTAP